MNVDVSRIDRLADSLGIKPSRLRVAALIAVFVLPVVAVMALVQGPSPKDAVTRYLAAVQNLDEVQAVTLICANSVHDVEPTWRDDLRRIGRLRKFHLTRGEEGLARAELQFEDGRDLIARLRTRTQDGKVCIDLDKGQPLGQLRS